MMLTQPSFDASTNSDIRAYRHKGTSTKQTHFLIKLNCLLQTVFTSVMNLKPHLHNGVLVLLSDAIIKNRELLCEITL